MFFQKLSVNSQYGYNELWNTARQHLYKYQHSASCVHRPTWMPYRDVGLKIVGIVSKYIVVVKQISYFVRVSFAGTSHYR